MAEDNFQRFANLGFEKFREMAKDDTLTANEKIGFPECYRGGKEGVIFEDIKSKVPPIMEKGSIVLDIGPGCGPLASVIIDHCRSYNHHLILVDSEEMLDHVPDEDFIEKVPAFYPECPELFQKYSEKVDVIICYSVLHYVFVEASFWRFLDKSMSLLNHRGHMLLGDIPNVSKRKRFFSSSTGVSFHKQFTGKNEPPLVEHLKIEEDTMDDSVILGLLMRARLAGFDSYVLP
ncbi:MAG: SAM-dependent methyltransferase, partial [Methanobacteriota archaeon]